ncbi:fused signal recognition particle receptor [Ferrithrix thermotolerans DSM 19514]|uniref:Signal recognition particle receptor FtsY n=1 Tax=Ferrithrix thermotolerans DSM 19514 TaxID=1121881 RepID=A0A1M4VYK8_9ACTN|nr:signal recognition particle-docking protein FtsY [Ferrithrix thermotolerans]SHE74134.1 fused signal recognition particle receptor [Ferrithrix thermotolerans DSM 19514]
MSIVLAVVVVVLVVVGGSAFFVLRSKKPKAMEVGTETETKPALKSPAGAPSLEGEEAGSKEPVISRGLDGSLPKSRSLLGSALARMRAKRALGEEFWVELEEALILSDLGLDLSVDLVESVRNKVYKEGVTATDAALEMLREEMIERLDHSNRDLNLGDAPPSVVLFVGVNGVGKTTSIGKLAALLSSEGKKVVVAAGDTFRAAAAEQLEMWAQRSDVQVVKGASGADPASVVFDAISHGAAVGADFVLADTAGRLQNRQNLMDELKKIRRVAEKASGTVTEVLLVLDATTGQNGLLQAQGFAEAASVTGVILTKLDGTAKGGVAFAIEDKLHIPIKFVGLGEGILDLVPFDPKAFVYEITGEVSQ